MRRWKYWKMFGHKNLGNHKYLHQFIFDKHLFDDVVPTAKRCEIMKCIINRGFGISDSNDTKNDPISYFPEMTVVQNYLND